MSYTKDKLLKELSNIDVSKGIIVCSIIITDYSKPNITMMVKALSKDEINKLYLFTERMYHLKENLLVAINHWIALIIYSSGIKKVNVLKFQKLITYIVLRVTIYTIIITVFRRI